MPGFAWHVHHNMLVEPLLVPLKERMAYIKECKPAQEQELRLRLLKPVKGTLPPELIEAGQAYNEARRAYDEAWQAYIEAGLACKEMIQVHKEEIERLHAEECPDCPWDGKTIFSQEQEEGG